MRIRSYAIAACILVISTAHAQDEAQEKHDLRGPAPKKDMVVITDGVVKIKEAKMKLNLGGQDVELTQTLTMTSKEEVKILEVEGRQATKAQTRVVKDEVKTVASFGGQDMSDTKTGELEGEIIISDRTGEAKWSNKLVDVKPTEEQEKKLKNLRGPENEDELYPANKVAVGHTWEVDASKMKTFTGNMFKEVSGKMKQKFLKIEKVNGEDCYVVESKGILKGKVEVDEGSEPEMEFDMIATSYRSVKSGVELKGTFSGTIKMFGKINAGGQEVEMSMEGPITGEMTAVVK